MLFASKHRISTYRLQGFDVHINQAVELALATLLGRLVVVGQTGTGVVERVDEGQRGSAGQTTRGHVAAEPLEVAILVLLEAKEVLEVVLEGKVQGLGGEVTDDVGKVSTPQRGEALVSDDAAVFGSED